jgi:hypothetical protein
MLFGGISPWSIVHFVRWSCASVVRTTVTAILVLTICVTGAHADERSRSSESSEPQWALTGFYGVFTDDNTFSDTLTVDADLNSDFKLTGLGLSRSFWKPNRHLQIEGEVQVVKHVEGQHHWELNGLGVARWLTFPWQKYLRTSFAFGAGLSFASEDPEFEVMEKGSSTNLLAYMLVEVEVGLPQVPEWSIVGRIHHRSTMFNMFYDEDNASSNAVALGVKYRF